MQLDSKTRILCEMASAHAHILVTTAQKTNQPRSSVKIVNDAMAWAEELYDRIVALERGDREPRIDTGSTTASSE